MNIYEHTTSITLAGGSGNTVSLPVRGGLLNYLLVRANTATTTFLARLEDSDDIVRLNYGLHEGELVDDKINMPVKGNWRVRLLNASVSDTFRIIFAVRE